MATQYAHPSDFCTETEPRFDVDDTRVQYDFDALMARRGRTFVFIDYLFEKRPSGLHGAVGSRMAPVHQDEVDRQTQQYKDPDVSPLYYLYEEMDPVQSWDKWIQSQFDHEGPRVIYDMSYCHKYGDTVEKWASRELGMHDVALVECVGGGRMFNEVDNEFDTIYDQELLRLAQDAEENGVSGFYQ